MNILNKLKMSNEKIVDNADDGINLNYYKATPITTIEVIAGTFNRLTDDQNAANLAADLFISDYAKVTYPKSFDILVTELDRRLEYTGIKDVFAIICKIKIYQGLTIEERPKK